MSSNQPPFYPDPLQPPAKPGMSAGTKVILILLIVFGVLLVVCCGGGMLAFYFAGSYMKNAVSEDPATIAATARRITQIDIPAGLEPAFSLDMKVPFSKQTLMVWAAYADKASRSTLVLAAMGEAMGVQNRAQMQQSMEQSLRQQGMGEEESIRIEKQADKQVEIRGQQATFLIVTGTGEKSHRPRIKVTGSFAGQTGPATLIFNGDAEKFPQAEIEKMLESIR